MTNPLRALFPAQRKALDSAHLYELLTRGLTSVSGQSVTEQSAMRVAAVYTCVSLISGTLASLPLHIYERRGVARARRDDHPVAILFQRPNRVQTRVDFLQQMQAALLLRGNAYARIVWDGTTPYELWPIHPDLVTVLRQEDDSLRYVVQRPDGGVSREYTQENMLHIRGLSSNGYLGRSVLADARDVIGIAQATQEHAGTFWAGGGMPDVLLRHPKTLGEKAAKNLEKSWAESYGGGSHQSRVAVLEEGMEAMPLSLTKTDSQFLETRQFQRSEIAGLFHVPPHMLGDTEKSTSWGTGIEQQQIGFVQYTMRRWLVTWEQAIWQQLIERERSYYAEFMVEALMRGDFKAQMDGFAVGFNNGWYSANDIRRKLNEPPIAGGDTYWRPLNMAPLTQVADPADASADAGATA